MINYMMAELRRIFSKKILYILAGIFVVCFAGLVVMKTKGAITVDGFLSDFGDLTMILTMFGGSFVFAAVYADDLGAKTLSQVIGFGRKKWMIVLAKLALMAVFAVLMGIFAIVLVLVIYGLALGFGFELATWEGMVPLLVRMFMIMVGYGALVSILVYGVQKAVLAVVAFAILSTGLVSQLIVGNILRMEVVMNAVGDLYQYTLFPIASAFEADMSLGNLVPFLVYVTVCTVLAILVFRKKELEF